MTRFGSGVPGLERWKKTFAVIFDSSISEAGLMIEAGLNLKIN